MNRSLKSFAVFACLVLISASGRLLGNDTRRTTIAITYPLDQTIDVPFHGTTRLPRLEGLCEGKTAGRRGARVELHLDNLPPAHKNWGGGYGRVLWGLLRMGTSITSAR